MKLIMNSITWWRQLNRRKINKTRLHYKPRKINFGSILCLNVSQTPKSMTWNWFLKEISKISTQKFIQFRRIKLAQIFQSTSNWILLIKVLTDHRLIILRMMTHNLMKTPFWTINTKRANERNLPRIMIAKKMKIYKTSKLSIMAKMC